jgi:hypothetical protein
MQVFDDRFQTVPSWLCLETVVKKLHETFQCRMYSRELLMMGREDARYLKSFITEKICLIRASGWLFKKKYVVSVVG